MKHYFWEPGFAGGEVPFTLHPHMPIIKAPAARAGGVESIRERKLPASRNG